MHPVLRSLAKVALCAVAMLNGPSGMGGQLTVSYTNLPAGSQVNLTTEGTADWVHWGEINDLTVTRKAGVGPQISDVETLSSDELSYVGYFRWTNNLTRFSWSDGTATLSATNSTNGVYVYSENLVDGAGVKVTAPADTRLRTLKLYVGKEKADGQLVAWLSDSSAGAYTNLFNDNKDDSRVYALTFAANSPDQQLNIAWTLQNARGGNFPRAILQAAALVAPGISQLPVATITSVTNGQNFKLGATIPLTVAASDLDGAVSNVDFYADGNLIGSTTNNPFSIAWSGATPGHHQLTAKATDNAGESSFSPPIEIYVFSGANILLGNMTNYPALQGVLPVNLTSEGTLDWISWGQANLFDVDRKTAVSPLISDYNAGADVPIDLLNTNQSYFDWSWSDGTPTGFNPSSKRGIQFVASTNGFQLQLEASPEGRRARIYLGDYGSRATIRAWFTNHSGPATWIPYPLRSIYRTSDGVVDLRYASVQPGQILLSFSADHLYDVLWGGTRLLSATVQPDHTLFLPLQIVNQQHTEQGLAFSFFTQPGHNYLVESTPALPATNWTVVANLPGTGNWLTVTNPPLLDGQGYFRVRTQ